MAISLCRALETRASVHVSCGSVLGQSLDRYRCRSVQIQQRLSAMSKEELEAWREQCSARGAARRQEREGAKARLQQVRRWAGAAAVRQPASPRRAEAEVEGLRGDLWTNSRPSLHPSAPSPVTRSHPPPLLPLIRCALLCSAVPPPQALSSGPKVVVDLDFAALMHEGELRSMCSQVAYCWSANCRAARPAHLVLASLCGKVAEGMQRCVTGYANWAATLSPHVGGVGQQVVACRVMGCHFSSGCVLHPPSAMRPTPHPHALAWDHFLCPPHPVSFLPLCPSLPCPALPCLQPYLELFADCKERLVYLTADSDNELQEVRRRGQEGRLAGSRAVQMARRRALRAALGPPPPPPPPAAAHPALAPTPACRFDFVCSWTPRPSTSSAASWTATATRCCATTRPWGR